MADEIPTVPTVEATLVETTKLSDSSDTLSPEQQEIERIRAQTALRLKLLGVTEEEMKRWNALKRLGLRNEDFEIGSELLAEQPVPENKKEEKITGYTITQIKRAKAVNILGVTEEAIDEARMIRLSSLGPRQQSL